MLVNVLPEIVVIKCFSISSTFHDCNVGIVALQRPSQLYDFVHLKCIILQYTDCWDSLMFIKSRRPIKGRLGHGTSNEIHDKYNIVPKFISKVALMKKAVLK